MLVANDSTGRRHIAWEVNKASAPFFCPACNETVILKKGDIRIHHFSHKPPITCSYGLGETEKHAKAKKGIFEALRKNNKCSNTELEKILDGARPDVYSMINGCPVAFEVQKSNIKVDEIKKKNEIYNQNKIFVVWIFPDTYPPTQMDDSGRHELVRPREWHKYLHVVFFGRLYFWQHDEIVAPLHFGPHFKSVPSGNWVNDYEENVGEDLSGTNFYAENFEFADYGGYEKKYKSIKRIERPQRKHLSLIDDFAPKHRHAFATDEFVIPVGRIWLDKLKKWW